MLRGERIARRIPGERSRGRQRSGSSGKGEIRGAAIIHVAKIGGNARMPSPSLSHSSFDRAAETLLRPLTRKRTIVPRTFVRQADELRRRPFTDPADPHATHHVTTMSSDRAVASPYVPCA